MRKLIKSLRILDKYTKEEHTVYFSNYHICVSVDPDSVSISDIDKLEKLGFFPSYGHKEFVSYNFWSM